MSEGNYFVLRLPSRAENVGLSRIAVAALASQLPFTLAEVEEVKVAVSEAVSNAVLHAYGAPGEIEVRARIGPGPCLEVTVQDHGRGMGDIGQARQAGFSTMPDRMGLGFAFMESFMDELSVQSGPEGTSVTMLKRPGGSDPRGNGS